MYVEPTRPAREVSTLVVKSAELTRSMKARASSTVGGVPAVCAPAAHTERVNTANEGRIPVVYYIVLRPVTIDTDFFLLCGSQPVVRLPCGLELSRAGYARTGRGTA